MPTSPEFRQPPADARQEFSRDLFVRLDPTTEVNFLHLRDFSPERAEGDALPIPDFLRRLIDEQPPRFLAERHVRSEHQDTDAEHMLGFLETFVRSERGRALLHHLGAESLATLSPAQAVQFSLRVVSAITTYSRAEAKVKYGETASDFLSPRELLEKNLAGSELPGWNGAGVCRNFAIAVRTIFQALKRANPSLQNCYCIYTGGWGHNPRKSYRFERDAAPHAWNIFVSLTEDGQASCTIADATWAKYNSATGTLENADYTKIRMEPVVQTMVESAKTPEAAHELLAYYEGILEEQRSRFARAEQDVTRACGQNLRRADAKCLIAKKQLRRIADVRDYYLQQLFVSAQVIRRRFGNERIPLSKPLTKEFSEYLVRYANELRGFSASDFKGLADALDFPLEEAARVLIRQSGWQAALKARSHSPALTHAIIDTLLKHEDAAHILNQKITLRHFIRSKRPDAFPEFHPETNIGDLREFRLLAGASVFLKKQLSKYLREKYRATSVQKLQSEDVLPITRLAFDVLATQDSEAARYIATSANNPLEVLGALDAYYRAAQKRARKLETANDLDSLPPLPPSPLA